MNKEFLKMQKIAGLITENQYRQLTENTDKPTHMSKVDWYYIGDGSDYPGPKGRTVPKAKGYDDPSKFEDTELYISVGTEGWIDGDDFMDEEENRVPYKGYEEYFGSVSGDDEDEYGELLTTYTPFHAENNEGLPLTNEVRDYIDNFMNMVMDEDSEEDIRSLVRAEFFENEFEETLIEEFGDMGVYGNVNSEVRRYIRQKVNQALHRSQGN
jgi:hypothetical protein